MSSASGSGSSGERPVAALADPFRPVTAGATVTLDGTGSYDPDNAAPAFPHGIEEFAWTLVAPDGSAAILSGTGGLATFAADVIGEFRGELVVVDADGLESEPVEFGVTAESIDPEADGLFVQMTWPSTASDLDLHLVHSGGVFAQAPLDCFYANLNPDWGAASEINDPLHEGDSSDGPGPEAIRVRDPQAVSYTVFVHLFSDEGLGPEDVAITITHDGILVAGHAKPALEQGFVWEVGTVTYASSNATPSFSFTDATFPKP